MEPFACCNLPCEGFGLIGITLIVLAILFDLVLKGFALWRAANNQQPIWFVFLLIINSVGILPLIYLFVVDKNKKDA